MANDFFNKSEKARNVFRTANRICGYEISNNILKGSPKYFNTTDKAQIGLAVVELAILEGMREKFPILINSAKFTVGQSLGQYFAAYASGMCSLDEIIRLVRERGKITQNVANSYPTQHFSMIVVQNINISSVRKLIEEHKNVFIAGEHTCDFCTVVGLTDEILLLQDKINKIPDATIIKINVSAPFHCNFMRAAINPLRKEFSSIKWNNPKLGFISDFDGNLSYKAEEIKNNFLSKQLTDPMLWYSKVDNTFRKLGVTHIIIVGDGDSLKRIINSNNKNIRVFVVKTMKDAQDVQDSLEKYTSH